MVLSASQVASDIGEYVKHLSRAISVSKAILYGSYAYGQPHAWSDVDVLILSPDFSKMERLRRFEFLHRVAWEAGADLLEPVGLTPEEFEAGSPLSLLGEVKERGIVVYDSTVPKSKRTRGKAKPAARRPEPPER